MLTKTGTFLPLKTVMQERVYGQHLVEEVVLNTIQGHVRNPNPAKALVLSFHGWTGGGKNYVSRLIAESLFKAGMDSNYVHLFVATLHFPHKSHLEEYKMQLREWITTNVTKCGWQLFIFDEMDKMQSGMIDVIKPFLDHYPEIRGVDYRKSIYIFLSNTGGNDISMKTYEHWEAGKKREDITVKEMDELLQVHAFNEQGGLWHSDLIEKHLISFFVPFLPLERSHVKKCIKDDMRSKGYRTDPDIIDKIANELQYSPQDSPVFSKSGCKRVSEKVNFVMFDFFNTEL
ncbi:torsin-1A-like isoform X2 [Ptychodera flava]|uniref:torsin-1A-like isoform X2 n=1 Tax=Ptychodera flava TaxID=63121 RepID=UPI00396AA5B3